MPLLLYDNFERKTREFTPLSTGEDKMEKGSRRTGKSAWEIAEEYTQVFREDLAALNITEPGVWCKATDHVPEQIAFIADRSRPPAPCPRGSSNRLSRSS